MLLSARDRREIDNMNEHNVRMCGSVNDEQIQCAGHAAATMCGRTPVVIDARTSALGAPSGGGANAPPRRHTTRRRRRRTAATSTHSHALCDAIITRTTNRAYAMHKTRSVLYSNESQRPSHQHETTQSRGGGGDGGGAASERPPPASRPPAATAVAACVCQLALRCRKTRHNVTKFIGRDVRDIIVRTERAQAKPAAKRDASADNLRRMTTARAQSERSPTQPPAATHTPPTPPTPRHLRDRKCAREC